MPICFEPSNQDINFKDAYVVFQNHVIRYESLRVNLIKQENICQHLKSNIIFYFFIFEIFLKTFIKTPLKHTRNSQQHTEHPAHP